MLKNIPKVLSPELLKTLMEMGHGDTIVLADGNFPAQNLGKKVVRADGHGISELLRAILELLPLDVKYSEKPIGLMEVVPGDSTIPKIWEEYILILDEFHDSVPQIDYIERYEFYKRAKDAYAIVATGEVEIYANIILTKGIV